MFNVELKSAVRESAGKFFPMVNSLTLERRLGEEGKDINKI